jgi:hypothetical protein
MGRLGAKAPTGPKARNPFSSTCWAEHNTHDDWG